MKKALGRAAREVTNLVDFGVNDLAYIIRWPLMGHLTKAEAARYANPPHPREPHVVLLPGVYETWQFLRPIAKMLHDQGYPVHAVAEMGHNSGPVHEMAARVARYLEENDLRGVVFVAHSKGGLIGKYVMGHTRAGERVRQMVSVNSPYSGSAFAHVIPMRTVRHFHPRHPTLSMLNESAEVNSRIVSICSKYDPLINPHEYMDAATNVPLDAIGHFRILKDPRVFETILAVVSGSYRADDAAAPVSASAARA